MQRTFVMVKPDGVQRGLVGAIISRFEVAQMKIIALKMIKPEKSLVAKHYPDSADWFAAVGGKTLEGYALIGRDVKSELGTNDPVEIGRMVKGWLVDFISSGNVVAMVLEGNMAVRNVRRLCGNTLPIFADPGSIRGRYGLDSPDAANIEKRPVYNVVHASGEPEEADAEIALWFPDVAPLG